MDDKSNLFVVRSPLQIINAIEAIEHFSLKNNVLVPIYGAAVQNKLQMEKLIEQYQWKKIIHIENKSKSKYFQYVKLIKELKRDKYKYLFVGELGSLQRILIPNITKEKVFLMDDGTETVEYYHDRIKVNKYNKYNFKELRFLFSGLKVKIRDKVNLFTYFDLESVNGIEVVRNGMNYFKEAYLKDSKKDEGILYFIGLPVHHSNVITIDTYKEILFNVIKKFNKKVIYIPHRSETANFIDDLSSLDEPLLEVKIINQPIELYLLENNIYPMHVISYFSTALTTLKLIYNDCKINVIEIPENDGNKVFFDFFLREFYETNIYLINKNQFITYEDLDMKATI